MGGEGNGNLNSRSHRGGIGVFTGSAELYGCILSLRCEKRRKGPAQVCRSQVSKTGSHLGRCPGAVRSEYLLLWMKELKWELKIMGKGYGVELE